MIPKVIHYCWFGGNPLPESVKKCIESWKKYCPDYDIIEWNEQNYDVTKNDYIKEAYEAKKYAFVSDYARLDVIYHEGGIYLDTDVELIKSLDDLLSYSCYMGFEQVGEVNTGLGFGAIRKHPFVLKNMKVYEQRHFIVNGKNDTTTCVQITTSLLKEKGLLPKNTIQQIEDVTILPTEYLCPYNMVTNKLLITQNTYSIHHYDATWYSENFFVNKLNKQLLPYKYKVKKLINQLFGENSYEKLKKVLKK